MAFNNGKPYHGSHAVMGGKLKGATGLTDYFFFLCPRCDNGQVLRVMDCALRDAGPLVVRLGEKRPKQSINMALQLRCPVCGFKDFIKIDNDHQASRLGFV